MATTTMTLPATLNGGVYTIDAAYSDPNIPDLYNAGSGAGALTLTASPPSPPAPPPPSPPSVAPVGSLSLFAFGFGPTGIDLFEVDSAGDIFAQPLLGGGGAPLFLNTALHLPLAVLQDGQLLALLAGSNGQNYLIDIFNPFSPLIEPAVIAALLHG